MSIRVVYASGAAVMLWCGVAMAQTNDQAADDETPIAVVGCVQREADYRRQNDSGSGGFLGTGLGTGNEYVLVDSTSPDCSTVVIGADAYELTGANEGDLEPFVGRRVEIAGMLEDAEIDPATGRPEGGFDPLGEDLRLFEVDVTSFREAPMALAQAETRPLADVDVERQPAGTSGVQGRAAVDEEALPRTASPLAIAGLIGLLSAGGGLGVRAIRRRFLSLR